MDLLLIATLAFLLWGAYRIGVDRGRDLERDATRFFALWEREKDPAKKKMWAMAWNRASGVSMKLDLETRPLPAEDWNRGAEARALGKPLSSNPFSNRLWGGGRRWQQGWKWIDKHPDWIETFRQRVHERGAPD